MIDHDVEAAALFVSQKKVCIVFLLGPRPKYWILFCFFLGIYFQWVNGLMASRAYPLPDTVRRIHTQSTEPSSHIWVPLPEAPAPPFCGVRFFSPEGSSHPLDTYRYCGIADSPYGDRGFLCGETFPLWFPDLFLKSYVDILWAFRLAGIECGVRSYRTTYMYLFSRTRSFNEA